MTRERCLQGWFVSVIGVFVFAAHAYGGSPVRGAALFLMLALAGWLIP